MKTFEKLLLKNDPEMETLLFSIYYQKMKKNNLKEQ